MTAILERLAAYRLPTGHEAAFQAAVAEVLTRAGWRFVREYDLGPDHGRIDFYLADLKVGLELKVQGSPSAVARQLLRYARSAEIAALVLVTGRSQLRTLPGELAGKALHISTAWRGQL